jgi:hypothetical protein
MVIVLQDFQLLASLYIAKFIVWRTLQRRDKENCQRREKFRLLQGGLAGDQRNLRAYGSTQKL